ncbi:glycosyltransferase family 2 protein [Candidatus Microgenomates bacterium]|nr:glycosyltransferase family 2 protein [Candidatus Microgenomates bacterium]
MKPRVTVIVSNYNGRQFLEGCINSILQEKSKAYEILFIDDGSRDGSYELVAETFSHIKNLRLLRNAENLGTSKALNRALHESKGTYIFFLNNDTILKPGWFTVIEQTFSRSKKIAVIQGKIYRANTKNFDYAGDYMGPFGFLIERAQGARDTGQFDHIDRVFSVKGTCLIIRKNVMLQVGAFDEDYRFGLDETDLTWRAWIAGYETIFHPGITVWHYYGTKKKTAAYYVDAKIHYEGCKNMIAMHIKNLGRKRLVTILPIHIACWLALACASLARLDTYKSSALFGGIWWNITHLARTLQKRRIIQKMRVISDDDLFALVGAHRDMTYYFSKATSYLTGKPF